MKKKFLLFVLFLTGMLTSCSISEDVPFETTGFAMGTAISQKVYGANSQKAAN